MDKLDELRKQIDNLDDQLLELLHKRIAIMEQIGEEKKILHKPIRDQQRESQKLTELERKAKLLNVPLELIKGIWKLFFEVSEEIEK